MQASTAGAATQLQLPVAQLALRAEHHTRKVCRTGAAQTLSKSDSAWNTQPTQHLTGAAPPAGGTNPSDSGAAVTCM